ncbi:ferrous iron transporter B [Hellea sp.]|nr:ferrous iron transporter B [Hellea sp.]MDC0650516.1 ferrous iron transporter B [Hellea sp.]MDC1062588.1 ferrous iron transporter B [Hellea sp.]MDC1088531.1 ferrous iron transporter B [Hellea sp.]
MSMIKDRNIRLALLGAPNCGKTSLFNALTGGRAKVANYPGVTVEYRKGNFSLSSLKSIELLDLPGVYGDCGHSMDERVAIDAIKGNLAGERAPDGLIFMMDASHITTHLHNILQAKSYGLPIILVLNMMDMAARDGIDIDIAELESLLDIPVIRCVAVRNTGRSHLVEFLNKWTSDILNDLASIPAIEKNSLKDLQSKARLITSSAVSQINKTVSLTQKIDNIVLHPFFGVIILAGLLIFMFQAVYWWAAPFMDGIDFIFSRLQLMVDSNLSETWLKSLISDGIIAGVGSVIIFLPQIIILFAFILLLEASGYMTRAAFLVDSLMAKVGLNGRAFIPLLSSFACAIPGIMAARTIEQEKDRLTTILIAPLMTCSARWPVYIMIIGAFIPDINIGFLGLQGLVAFCLVLGGIIFAMIMAYIFKKTLMNNSKSILLIELPSYKLPVIKDYFIGLLDRALIFINRAGRIILPASIIIWFLASYPTKSNGIIGTFAGKIGSFIEPILRPIGFNLEIAISLIPGMAAREVVVGALATIYSLNSEAIDGPLKETLQNSWSLPTALSFLVWFVFAPQCLSTLAIMRKETNSWKWPLFAFFYLFVLAYLMAGITYQIAVNLGL